ncbi:hypothetical protein ACSQ67_009396 [Phaseolus vulgaris]
MFAPMRREELGVLVKSLKRSAASGEVVDLSELVAEVVEKMVFRMMLGRVKDDRLDLKKLIQEVMNLVGAFNLADYMPWLGFFDPQKHDGKTAPGPKPLPIIGNLHMLGKLPHRTLQSLATKYGPIMSLKLGQIPAIVVSSPETAELFLKTHDTVFASRPKIQASDFLSHGSKGLAFSEYSAYWRNMRKVCTVQLLSASRVEMFAPMRREELGVLVKSLKHSAASGEVVDLSELLAELMEKMVFKMVLGCAKDDRLDLKKLIQEALNLVGAFNLADYIPWLRVFDLQALTKRLKKASKSLDKGFEQIIQDKESNPNDKDKKCNMDFVEVLLSLIHQPNEVHNNQNVIDRTNIKAIILDIIAGALETSSTSVRMGHVELLRHPSVMKRLQHELEHVVGMNRYVEENDLENLSYLNMVKKSRIIVNAWAIGRDPKVWNNAAIFDPTSWTSKDVVSHSLHTYGRNYLRVQDQQRQKENNWSIHSGLFPRNCRTVPQNHDTVFASRPKIQASEFLSHGCKGLVFSEYSEYWRNMRKVCTVQLLSVSRVEMFAPMRREELGMLVKTLKNCAASGEVVDLSELVAEMVEKMVFRMVLGRVKDDRLDLIWLIKEAMNLVGAFNFADYMPWLGVFDLQEITTRLKKASKSLAKGFEQIIQDKESNSNDKDKKGNMDFVEVLLSLMHQPNDVHNNQNVIDRTNIKAIILDMIGGALETSSTTLEWAMSNS